MSGYRPVRVAGDKLVYYAEAEATHTLGCAHPITPELPQTDEHTGDPADGEGQRPCGPCVVEWMAATGRIRLVRRLPVLARMPATTIESADGQLARVLVSSWTGCCPVPSHRRHRTAPGQAFAAGSWAYRVKSG